jgi:hypothetical protein
MHYKVIRIAESYILQSHIHYKVIHIVELYALQSRRIALIGYINAILVDGINVLGTITS